MTTVQNNTTPTTALDHAEVKAPQPKPQNGASLLKAAKSAIILMNKEEARSRKATAEMVAAFVQMGFAYLNDKAVITEIDAECKRHGITPVNLETETAEGKSAPNVFLPMMSIVDGKWVDLIDSKTGKPLKVRGTGKTKQKWKRNRSFEKYASVIRFFIHNGISHTKVVEILMSDKPIKADGIAEGVKPRITDIVKADTLQQNGKRRVPQIWTPEVKAMISSFEPIAVMSIPSGVSGCTFSDGYIGLFGRVVGEEFQLFDSGLLDDELYRFLKNRAVRLAEALVANTEGEGADEREDA